MNAADTFWILFKLSPPDCTRLQATAAAGPTLQLADGEALVVQPASQDIAYLSFAVLERLHLCGLKAWFAWAKLQPKSREQCFGIGIVVSWRTRESQPCRLE